MPGWAWQGGFGELLFPSALPQGGRGNVLRNTQVIPSPGMFPELGPAWPGLFGDASIREASRSPWEVVPKVSPYMERAECSACSILSLPLLPHRPRAAPSAPLPPPHIPKNLPAPLGAAPAAFPTRGGRGKVLSSPANQPCPDEAGGAELLRLAAGGPDKPGLRG